MNVFLIKHQGKILPVDGEMSGIPEGQVMTASIAKPRNVAFHRKFFALIRLAFDYFEPQEVVYRGEKITPKKDEGEFRKWLTVKAGYFEVIGYPDGSVRVRAKSIRFASMSQEDFEALYSAMIDVVLAEVMTQLVKREDVEKMVDIVLGFV